ncbi:MAG: transcription-repair coupling factor [Erysipelotrichaceae bacterium]|nr:transcription-repair coupling factor [Erysipelotrichaceae bacterium]
MKKYILESFKNNPELLRFDREKKLSDNSWIQQALIIAASYYFNPRPIVYVCQNLYNAQRFYERLLSLLDEDSCVLFGVEDSLRVEAIAASPELMAAKVEALDKIIHDNKKIIVCNSSALVRYLPNIEVFKECCIELKIDMEIAMEDLKALLIKAGYQQVTHIDTPLTFAMRGGIIDVYSINYDEPLRIEFFDNYIESIRFFDSLTQKTLRNTQEARVICASDVLFSDQQVSLIEHKAKQMLDNLHNEELRDNIEIDLGYLKAHICENHLYSYYTFLDDCHSILDYVGKSEVILNDEEAVYKMVHDVISDNTSYIQEMVQENKMLPRFAQFFDLSRVLANHLVINSDPYGDNISNILNVNVPRQSLELNIKMLSTSEKPVLLFLKDSEFTHVINICVNMQIPYNIAEGLHPGLNLVMDTLFEGFECDDYLVVTSYELFEVKPRLSRYANKFKNAQVINSYQELEPGDYIVHTQHGVGQYMGIETKKIMGFHKDFLRIIYKGNAELLVPLEQFKLVRKFVSSQGVVPKLNKLGSDEWTKTKERLQANVEDIAARLLELYSKRKEDIGYKYPQDTEDQKAFEKEFPYELTSDQAKAIIEVKQDMEMDKPMDRLLCGDVGFGKTEVAIRASFKAVHANKQVVYLCPTTILANQHFKTFKERFKNYAVNIRLLNRFVTPQQQKLYIEEIKAHKVDIVIGTHRVLSDDVKFADLGLLIIDEEQRFGVEQKEKIKELKVGVDVLSLSATPIPRSLQMSLVGIRQLSQLETPPSNRHTVQTYVVEKNDGLIKNAIEKELARGGQVFYLYNNVEQIYNVARKIQSLIDGVRVKVAHGKMSREEIEDVMNSFVEKEVDVLVCTTIVETGIDIPNANTMIVDGAQNFGLSQLYQIKGRVGRSEAIAYAYLMIPPKRQLTEIASKRLKAIKEFAQLGSGYKIAMRDLTIRGAGDLLGPKQSGFIDTVGIDMYIEMLQEAINRQKGIESAVKEEIIAPNINVEGYIPKNFVSDDFDKISMYQEIDKITSLQELQNYKNKIIDEYGRLPEVFTSLFDKKRLALLLLEPNVEKYRDIKGQSEITFAKEFSDHVDGVKLFSICSNISKDAKLRYVNQRIIITLPKVKDPLSLIIKVIEQSKEALK